MVVLAQCHPVIFNFLIYPYLIVVLVHLQRKIFRMKYRYQPVLFTVHETQIENTPVIPLPLSRCFFNL